MYLDNQIMACRICLNTDTRLYDILKYKLADAYETVCGTSLNHLNHLPRGICSVCSTMVMKYAKFHDLCQQSQDLMIAALKQKIMLSVEDIKELNSKLSNLKMNLCTKTVEIDDNIAEIFTVTPDIKIELVDEEMPDEKLDVAILHPANNINQSINQFSAPNESEKKRKKSKLKKEDDGSSQKKAVVTTRQKCQPRNPDQEDRRGQNKLKLDSNEIDIVNLTDEQQMEEIEVRKKSANYLNALYKCEQCFKGFLTEVTYSNHMVRHDPRSGAHSCAVCRVRWPSAGKLRAHMSKHRHMYVCKRCPYVTRTRTQAHEHYMYHQGQMHICEICGAVFSKRTSYLSHVRVHHPSDVRCELCAEAFINEHGLKCHMYKSHSDVKSLPKKLLDTLCARCKVQFSNVQALKLHTCDTNLSQCVKCGQGFDSRASLEAHTGACRGEDSAPETYQCEQCPKTYRVERKLAYHRVRAHGLPYGAGDSAAGKRAFVCEVCGRSFSTNLTRINHHRIHTGEKPHQCPECPKRFRLKQLLQVHLRTHTGELPYKCSLCPKAFSNQSALNRHMRIHTGAKPYACPHCGRTFAHSNTMKGHVSAVHLKIPLTTTTKRKKAKAQ